MPLANSKYQEVQFIAQERLDIQHGILLLIPNEAEREMHPLQLSPQPEIRSFY